MGLQGRTLLRVACCCMTPLVCTHLSCNLQVRKTTFEGVTGIVSYDVNGDRDGSYVLWNVHICRGIQRDPSPYLMCSCESWLAFLILEP